LLVLNPLWALRINQTSRHLAFAETVVDGTMVELVTGVFIASHPPSGGIVGTATQSRGRHLVRVLRHAKRAHGTGTILVITTAEEMAHGTDTGIAGVDEGV
jgi:hypothetical protein